MLKKKTSKRKLIGILFVLFAIGSFASNGNESKENDTIISNTKEVTDTDFEDTGSLSSSEQDQIEIENDAIKEKQASSNNDE